METCAECGFAVNDSDTQCRQCGVSLIPPTVEVCLSSAGIREAALEINSKLADRYTITEIHFSRGDTVYYSAWDGELTPENSSATPCWIAERSLSTPKPEDGSDTKITAALSSPQENPFARCAKFLSATKMVGLPKLIEWFETNEYAYLVVERQISTPLGSIGPLPETEVCRIGIQICRILALVHRAGLVHNGIDVNSLWIDIQGHPWLMCFEGLRPAGPYNPQSPILVSQGYTAPELMWLNAQSRIDYRSDIYSVGCLLYFLLTGNPLTSRPLEACLTGTLGFYPAVLVSPALERIITRAFSINPNDRYASIVEMASALIGLSLMAHPRAGSYTDVGRHRDLNEDSVLVMELRQYYESNPTSIGVYAVSDGMGGEAAGEVASRLTVRSVAKWVMDRLMSPSLNSVFGNRLMESTESGDVLLGSDSGVNSRATQLLSNAILHANSEVLEYAVCNPQAQGLGATITVALIIGNILTVGQVGDSRCYVLNQGRMDQITEDHSLVERMVRRGELTPEEARLHPHKNIIYRAIGSREEIEVDIVTRRLRLHDTVLLCSDGLTGMLEDAEIKEILNRHSDPAEAARELVIAANAAGGEDNVSAVVIRFG